MRAQKYEAGLGVVLTCNKCLRKLYTNNLSAFRQTGWCHVCNELLICNELPYSVLQVRQRHNVGHTTVADRNIEMLTALREQELKQRLLQQSQRARPGGGDYFDWLRKDARDGFDWFRGNK